MHRAAHDACTRACACSVEWLSCGRAEDRVALGRIWAEWLGSEGSGSPGVAAPLPTPKQLLRMR